MLDVTALIAQTAADDNIRVPLVTHPVGILALLLAVLAGIFWVGERTLGKGLFKIVPKLVFCYFVPTLLTTLGVLPAESELYDWIKSYLLPASLVLLILSLDLPGIIRLGPKAGIMLLAGTAGVMIGAPVALLVCELILPESALPADTWQGMAALTGSWIGGGANMVALADIAGTSSDMFSKMIIVDVFIANIWMGVLLYSAGVQEKIDKATGANTKAIYELQRRMEDFQAKTTRVPTLTDLIIITALGIGGAYLAYIGGDWLAFVIARTNEAGESQPVLSATTWKFILVTTGAVLLSMTPVRNLEGAGASRIGSLFLFILVASIGAHANFNVIKDAPYLVLLGAIWMAVHIIVLLTVAKIIRAPIFFVAVGSQANIGGAASAPIVASAFHPTLAPVGVLLAVAGYVLGTYCGIVVIWMLKAMAGA